MHDLQRFKDAQNAPHSGFETALAEIQRGHKEGHWIWYIFPQLRGLGRSAMSETFGIDGESEAIAYLRDPELSARLITMTSALLAQRSRRTTLSAVMGSSLDAAKVISSMTLFSLVARTLRHEQSCRECDQLVRDADTILAWGAEEGLGPCEYTRSNVAVRGGQ
jgi:uncharacterized protein (DUF1810 family)